MCDRRVRLATRQVNWRGLLPRNSFPAGIRETRFNPETHPARRSAFQCDKIVLKW